MNSYTAYWIATLVRGVLALLASIVVMTLCATAETILLLPLAIVFSFLALGAYVACDSAIVLATSFMLPHHRLGSIALRIQGIAGVVIGLLFFLFASNKEQFSWLIYLVVIQALCVGVAEFIVARRTSPDHSSRWCYASSVIAIISSMILLLNHHAQDRTLGFLIYGYLACFGLNLFVLAGHMLFEQFHQAVTPRLER